MNKDVKKTWVNALRRGPYTQTRNKLRAANGRSYCCLGVLCKLHSDQNGTEWTSYKRDNKLYFKYQDHETDLPGAVYKWAGMSVTHAPKVAVPRKWIPKDILEEKDNWHLGVDGKIQDTYDFSLISCNDILELNFKQIAKLIEEQL